MHLCFGFSGLEFRVVRGEDKKKAARAVSQSLAETPATRTIAVMNQKGGVGKTTLALNLGAALAERGLQVLLVDLDPQANLTRGLGLKARGLDDSSYQLLAGGADATSAASLVRPTRWENLALIPSHMDLSGAELELALLPDRERRLQARLAPLVEHFDYVLIDCNPSLSLLTINAMVACAEIFVPMQTHPFALESLGKFMDVMAVVKANLNPVLHLNGVFVTMYDPRTNVSKQVLDILEKDPRLSPHLFKTLLRNNIRIPESQRDGVPVIHFDKQSHGAKAFRALAREVAAQTKLQAKPNPAAANTAATPSENVA